VLVDHGESMTREKKGIGSNLRCRYRLGYMSSSTARDGRWRDISVGVSNKDLGARTRAGCYAPGSPDADQGPSE
jgi:hypothetical protein